MRAQQNNRAQPSNKEMIGAVPESEKVLTKDCKLKCVCAYNKRQSDISVILIKCKDKKTSI